MSTPMPVLFRHFVLTGEKSGAPAFAYGGETSADDDIKSAREMSLRYAATTLERMVVADKLPVEHALRFFGIEPKPVLTGEIEAALSKRRQPERIEALYTIFDRGRAASVPTADCLLAQLKYVRKPWSQEDVERAWEECAGKP